MISTALKIASAAAVVIAVYGAGYAHGNRNVDRAAETMAAMFAVLNAPSVQAVLSDDARQSIATARDAVADDDFDAATSIISSKIADIAQTDCQPSGKVFAAEAGALVKNCETGMSAAVASINSNGTTTVTIGDRPKSGAPGTAFADTLGRFESCFLVYVALEDGSDPLQARLTYDCGG